MVALFLTNRAPESSIEVVETQEYDPDTGSMGEPEP
jgi:hypothetical protein